nr:MAG TPA: hypothetical protein [Caudoviricetes sp.]
MNRWVADSSVIFLCKKRKFAPGSHSSGAFFRPKERGFRNR